MSLSVSVSPDESRLELIFEGNLDVSVAISLCDLCKRMPPRVTTCVVDLTRVERVFDSGEALLRMVLARLADCGAHVVVRADRSRLTGRVAALTAAA
jgi:ABC-type transporter Mla MlaB component